jgi:HEAT repeat protein
MRLFGLFGRPNIAELKAKGQIDELIKALHFPDDHNVRFEAASALGEIGDPRCVDPLITALDDTQRVKEVAIRSLGKIGDPRAVDPLLEALKDDNWEVRGMAAKALGEIGDQQAVQALIEALQNDTEAVRWYITQALTHITGQPFGNDVSQWQKWQQENKIKETE